MRRFIYVFIVLGAYVFISRNHKFQNEYPLPVLAEKTAPLAEVSTNQGINKDDTFTTYKSFFPEVPEEILTKMFLLSEMTVFKYFGIRPAVSRDEAVSEIYNEFMHSFNTSGDESKKFKSDNDLIKYMEERLAPLRTLTIYSDSRDYLVNVLHNYSQVSDGKSRFEKIRQIIHAISNTWKTYKPIYFPPSSKIIFESELPPMPEPDETLSYLNNLNHDYWRNSDYHHLTEMNDSELPAQALFYLSHLLSIPTTAINRGDDVGITFRKLLPRFGESAYPFIVRWLTDPLKYGLVNSDSEFLSQTHLRLCQGLSPTSQGLILKAALESGWWEACKHIDADISQAFYDTYKEGYPFYERLSPPKS